VQQYQEEVQEVAKEASMLLSPLQQQDSSSESTPSRVRSLVDIYESCNTTMIDPKCYEESSKKQRQLRKSNSSTTREKPKMQTLLWRHYQESSSSYVWSYRNLYQGWVLKYDINFYNRKEEHRSLWFI